MAARTENGAALVDRLAAAIQARVLAGDLAPGERLPQESLAGKRRRNGGPPPEKAHRDWIAANDLFHLAVLDAAGNERLRATLADLHVSFPRDLTWIVLGESSRLLEENVAQHEEILAAIE